jgi:hypothetical protein
MKSILWGLGLTLLVSCSSPNPNLPYQERWAKQQISNYNFTLKAICFCPNERVDPVRIEVRNGQVASLVYVGTGTAPSRNYWDNENTIDKLFAIILSNSGKPNAKLEVTYDSTLSYPTRIFLDPIPNAVDDEVLYEVSSFERLP